MADREQPTGAAAHKVADVLLPWLVNGTLEGDERAFVEAHVRECPQCQGEVEWLRGLHAACAATGDSPQGARATRRLREALDSPRVAARARMNPVVGWAFAGLAAAFIAVGGAWIGGVGSPALYRTLGARDSTTPASGSIVVVFDPATTEFELRRILRGAAARIVDGPTQTNAYVLDVPAPQRAQVLAALRAERAVILAERLDGGAPR